MNPGDRQAFMETVIGMAELKGKKLSAAGIEIYWRTMQHWPMPAFQEASVHLLRSIDYMPEPKHFEDLRRAGRDVTAEAWLKAKGSTSTAWTARGYTGGTCGDELIDKAVRCIGGYGAIAMCESSKLHFLKRDFEAAYESILEATVVRLALPAIARPTTLKQLQAGVEQRRLANERK